jgi:DNA repair exonuclease SbcCD ATPase subunit
MIRLEHLTIDGLKAARGVSLRIPALLAVQGMNGSGKTTILQAIRLATMGYEPSVGMKLEHQRQLIGEGGEMEVGLQFDRGFGIRRRFGDKLRTEVAPPRNERLEKEREARITEETGKFLPAFDLGNS